MSYTLAGNLDHRRDGVREVYPDAVIYDIGDESHQQNQSDHNRDARDIVHALDVMCYSNMAMGRAVRDWCLSNPDDLEYIIFDHKIYEREDGFEPSEYYGSDPHEDHVHISGKHGSVGYSDRTGTGYDTAAEAMRPPGMGDGDMAFGEQQQEQLDGIAWAVSRGWQVPGTDDTSGQAALYWSKSVNEALTSLITTVNAIAESLNLAVRAEAPRAFGQDDERPDFPRYPRSEDRPHHVVND